MGRPLTVADDRADLDYCYLTTTGRRSGCPHTIEIWFALQGHRVYLLAGGGEGSDWVRNIRNDPTVGLRVGGEDFIAKARVVEDPEEDALARRLLLEKYGPRYPGDLDEWGRTAVPVVVELPLSSPGGAVPVA
ncbi:MAG TPA: nitroreductase/quinone reductase family protein [Actinomycetota bacterium]|nr:nitroreductase/quinone reductase family protein [Actinomycetota bacterium]